MGKFPPSTLQVNRLTSLYYKTSLSLLHPYSTQFGVDYEDADSSVQFKANFLPFTATNILAQTSVIFSRKLWRRHPQRAQVALQFGRQPSASFKFISPSPLNVISEESTPPQLLPPTIYGLNRITFDKRFGIIFNHILPTLVAEVALTFTQLSTQLKCAINYDLISGISFSLGGEWSSGTSEVSSALVVNNSGILLQFESVSMLFLISLKNSLLFLVYLI